MFSKRQKEIVSYVMKQNKGISGKALGELISVSDRTVRNDIMNINHILQTYDCRIAASKSQGYYIESEDRRIIQEVLQIMDSEDVDTTDRIYAILGHILFMKTMSLVEAAEQLYVSDQTIYRDVNRLQNMLLADFSIDLFDVKNNTLYRKTDEQQIRMLFFRMSKLEILKHSCEVPFHLKLMCDNHFEHDVFEQLLEDIRIFYQEHDVILSSDSLYMLVWALYFTILKNEEEQPAQIDNLVQSGEDIVLNIVDYLRSKGYHLYEHDQLLLQNYMKTLGMMKSNKKLIVISEDTRSIMYEFHSEILRKYDFDINRNAELYDNILLHIEIMRHRLKEHLQLMNPMLEDVKQRYPYAYEIAMLIVPILYKYEGSYLIDDEISYIAIYLQYYLELMDVKIQAILVSGSGAGITKLLRQWIVRSFSDVLDVEICIPSYEMEHYLETHDTELIISTVPLKEDHHMIVYVNGIASSQDKENIEDCIYRLKNERKLRFAIESVFRPQFFKRFEDVISFEQAINEMSLLLYKENIIKDHKEFVQCVIDREKVYPTRINERLMAPHPLKELAQDNTVVIGVLKQGTSQNRELRCILLLALNSAENQDLEILFQFINLLANDEKNMMTLVQSNQHTIITNLIQIAERKPL